MRRSSLAAQVVALLLVCESAVPGPVQDQAELERLEQRAAEVHDLTAEFRQEKRTPILRRPLVSKGKVQVKPPFVRWDTVSPHPSSMLVDGSNVRIFFPVQSTVEIYLISEQLGQVAGSPLLRPTQLAKQFDIRLEDFVQGTVDGELVLHLVPRTEALRTHVERIRLVVDRARALVKEAEVVGPEGDHTQLRFTNIQVNTQLTEQSIQLQLPSDVQRVYPIGKAEGEQQ